MTAVVHSMDIASAVGAERLREIMANLIDRASARATMPHAEQAQRGAPEFGSRVLAG